MTRLAAGIVAGVAILGSVAAFALTYPSPAGGEAGNNDGAGNNAAAAAILEKTAAAYANAAGLTDLMRLDFAVPNGREIVEVPYAFGGGTDSSIAMPGFTATAIGKTVYVVRSDISDKYAELTLAGNLPSTLEAIFPGDAGLPVAFDMKLGRGMQRYLTSLGLGALEKPRLSGYEMIDNGTPHGVHQVGITADNGTASVHIDGKTHLLSQLSLDARMGDGPESTTLDVQVTFAPKVHVSPSGLVSFDAGTRRKVDSFRALQPTPAVVGDLAPDFTLRTLDGQTVTLSDLRGSVVVIDFWATWCRPCIMGLPLLNDFHDWARESGRPIEVYAINTFENGPAERVEQKAASFWKSREFTVPTLLDPGSEAVGRFGIQSIPTTYVIDTNGVIAKIHRGFDPNMATSLQKEVLEVLDE